jgi:DNA-directed RNA polymerase specialized sigma24 family protein
MADSSNAPRPSNDARVERFESLLREVREALRRFIARPIAPIASKSLELDVLEADVHLTLWTAFHKFHGDDARDFLAFSRSVAKWVARRRRGHRARGRHAVALTDTQVLAEHEDPRALAPDRTAEECDLRSAVADFVRNDESVATLRAAYLDGRNAAEIAVERRVSESTIRRLQAEITIVRRLFPDADHHGPGDRSRFGGTLGVLSLSLSLSLSLLSL